MKQCSSAFILCCCIALSVIIGSSSSAMMVHAAPTVKNAPVYLTTTTAFYDGLAGKVVLPLLDSITKNISIPTIKISNGSLTLDVDAFVADLTVGRVSFNISSPADIVMHLDLIKLHTHAAGASASTPISFKLKEIVSCSGTMQPENNNDGRASIDIALIANKTVNSKTNETEYFLSVGDVSFPSFILGDLAIHLKTPGILNWACDAAVKALEKLSKDTLGQLLSGIIQKELPSIAKLLTDAMQKIMDGDMHSIPLTEAPKADPALHGLTVAVDLSDLLNISGGSVIQQQQQQQQQTQSVHSLLPLGALRKKNRIRAPPRLSSSSSSSSSSVVYIPDRDFSIALQDTSINALLFKLGPKLNWEQWTLGENWTTAFFRSYIPLAYYRCPGCPIVFTSKVFYEKSGTSALSVSFQQGNLSVSCQGASWIVQANKTSSSGSWSLVDLFTFGVDAAGSFENFKIIQKGSSNKPLLHFELALDEIKMTTVSTNVGPLDPSVIAWLIKSVLSTTVLPLINDLLYIPVPSAIDIKIGNFSISELKTQMGDGMLVLGSNVKF